LKRSFEEKLVKSTHQELVLLDASVDVGRVKEPLSGRDASQHLLAAAQLGGDHVGRVNVADVLVAEIDGQLRKKFEESKEKKLNSLQSNSVKTNSLGLAKSVCYNRGSLLPGN
jgi:hypothetical protein